MKGILILFFFAFSALLFPAPARAQAPDNSCASIRARGPGFAPLADVCDYALSLPRVLPDLVCTETVQRQSSPKKKPDVITAAVRIERMHTHYTGLVVNGRIMHTAGETSDAQFQEHVTSTGEFALLFDVFRHSSQAEFAPAADDVVGHQHVKRYDFRVLRENNKDWTWYFIGAATNPGYHGSVFVDPANGKPVRLTLNVSSDELGEGFPIANATTTLDYANVVIGALGTHLVPVRGEHVSCFRGALGCIRETLRFGDFHKFGADTRIVP